MSRLSRLSGCSLKLRLRLERLHRVYRILCSMPCSSSLAVKINYSPLRSYHSAVTKLCSRLKTTSPHNHIIIITTTKKPIHIKMATTVPALIIHNFGVAFSAFEAALEAAAALRDAILRVRELRALIREWVQAHPDALARMQWLGDRFWAPYGAIFSTQSGVLMMFRLVYWIVMNDLRDQIDVRDPEDRWVYKLLDKAEEVLAALRLAKLKAWEAGQQLMQVRFRLQAQEDLEEDVD